MLWGCIQRVNGLERIFAFKSGDALPNVTFRRGEERIKKSDIADSESSLDRRLPGTLSFWMADHLIP